ncbi:MAG: hypothetical protein CMI09_11715 [Oceanospirillaceae bacterium]|nr:hypothetical protein [Oceanospirillaceae bacterium]|tara:strand:+ start:70 stop:846 length:777 start_codon:yes stop_codon:yes gene_type:complete
MSERVEIYKPYLGSGQVYLKQAGDAIAPRYPIGNVSELKLAIDEEVLEQKDHTLPGGGTHAEVRRVNAITASLTLHDLNADNLALATKGTTTAVASGSVTDESHTAHKGALLRLVHPGAASVVVTSDPSGTTYTEGTDYEVRGEGVFILSTGAIATAIDGLGTPSAGLPLLITYSFGAYNQIQALTNSSNYWEISFGGMNEADGDKPCVIDLWKVNLGAAKEVPLITGSLGSVALEGKLLSDSSKGSGESKFYQVQQV